MKNEDKSQRQKKTKREKLSITICFYLYNKNIDRAEKHDLKSRFLLFNLIYFFKRDEKRITNVILSHTLVLDQKHKTSFKDS